jgi:hypothetical protein
VRTSPPIKPVAPDNMTLSGFSRKLCSMKALRVGVERRKRRGGGAKQL